MSLDYHDIERRAFEDDDETVGPSDPCDGPDQTFRFDGMFLYWHCLKCEKERHLMLLEKPARGASFISIESQELHCPCDARMHIDVRIHRLAEDDDNGDPVYECWNETLHCEDAREPRRRF